MIEPSDIRITNYLKLNGKPVKLTVDLMEQIQDIQDQLSPINITPVNLSLLGFVYSGGNRYKSFGSIKLWLMPLRNDRWKVAIEGSTWTRVIDYVHELQNIWYNLFQDELFRPAPPPVVQMTRQEHEHPLYPAWQKDMKRISDEERKLNGGRSKYKWKRLPYPTFEEFKKAYYESNPHFTRRD